MSKQIDNLLDSLIKEIDAKDGGTPAPKEPKPASPEALERAEKIAKKVDKNYRRPPEPVKQSIPAPNIKPVIEPEPTSHFSDARSNDPAIRMHDRLDESTLPAPDVERRPTQIMDINGKRKNKKRKTRSIPAPPEAPARKIPHINVPDELPPDVANEPAAYEEPVKYEEPETDPEREELVRSRAEKIREQLKHRTLERTPIIPPPTPEEIDDMLNTLEHPEEKDAEEEEVYDPEAPNGGSIFAYLHQVLGVEEEPEEEPAEEEPAESRPRWFDDAPSTMPLHHAATTGEGDEDDEDDYDEDDLSADADAEDLHFLEEDETEAEPEEKRVNPIVAFFRNLFGKHKTEETEEDDADEELSEDDASEEDEIEGYEEYEKELNLDADLPATEVPLPEDDEDYPAPPMPSFTGALDDADDDAQEDAADEPEEAPAYVPEDTLGEYDDDLDDFGDEEDTKDEEDADEAIAASEDASDSKPEHHSFFRDAFDESAEELADMKAEPTAQPEAEPAAKTHFLGRNSYFIAGILVFILAVIGLITVISSIFKTAGGFFQGDSLKSQLEQTLYPVAVVDVPTFNEPAELTADGALSAAIVDILMHDDLSGYTETFDMIAVPAEDVLERGRQLFGVDVQTKLSTLHAAGESFVYDEATECYNVPTSPMIFSYSPEVRNIKRNGDTYEVTVVYNSDVADWQEHSRNFTEGNSKTMQATIEKKSSGYRIVRLVPAN